MLHILFERLRQKRRTVAFPASPPVLPERFRGRPALHADRWIALDAAERAHRLTMCPTRALGEDAQGLFLDMGLCTFCGVCALPDKAVEFTGDWRLGASKREGLIIRPGSTAAPEIVPTTHIGGAFRRSLRLRQVSAAGCGACEADLNVLSTVVFDLARFGLDFVASPRHADAMALTGPLPRNMLAATRKCGLAMPGPKLFMAIGACAISGGLFRSLSHTSAGQGAEGMSPHFTPDLFIPGCPPHPYTTLDAWLRLLGVPTPAPA